MMLPGSIALTMIVKNEALSATLREFADKLDAGEARVAARLSVVPDLTEPDGAG